MVVSRSRCLLVWLVATLAALTTGGWAAPDLGRLQSPGSFASLLPSVAALALVACALWCWAVTTLVVLAAVHGGPRSGGPRRLRAVPLGAQRLVLLACGVALVGVGQVAPAHAAPGQVVSVGDPHGGGGGGGGGVRALVGLPLPDRTTGARTDRRPRAPSPSTTGAGAAFEAVGRAVTAVAAGPTLVVAPGDSLWSIAERLLPPSATTSDVAGLVRRLHEVNRSEIGDDPDLILPGHQLRTPLGERPTR